VGAGESLKRGWWVGPIPTRSDVGEDLPGLVTDLVGGEREEALPVILDSFEGIYRWHAKRTLREVSLVRAVRIEGQVRAISMLERLVPEVGYVYYLAVAKTERRKGLGRVLLDDALQRFEREGAEVVFAAAGEDNAPSIALFRSRGFRTVERKEPSYRDGGLGAWGLRSRMRIVWGEVLLGKRIVAHRPTLPEGASGR
jgi:L-amino acid N-acyltransferase YncA